MEEQLLEACKQYLKTAHIRRRNIKIKLIILMQYKAFMQFYSECIEKGNPLQEIRYDRKECILIWHSRIGRIPVEFEPTIPEGTDFVIQSEEFYKRMELERLQSKLLIMFDKEI